MANLYNATAHDLIRYDASQVVFDKAIRKNVLVDSGAKPVQVIPKGIMLNARRQEIAGPVVGGFPTSTVVWSEVDDLPAEALEADGVVVSAIYAAAYRATRGQEPVPFYVICNPVCVQSEANTTKVVGCLGLQLL